MFWCQSRSGSIFPHCNGHTFTSMDPIILPISRSKEISARYVSIKGHACTVLLSLPCLKELMLRPCRQERKKRCWTLFNSPCSWKRKAICNHLQLYGTSYLFVRIALTGLLQGAQLGDLLAHAFHPNGTGIELEVVPGDLVERNGLLVFLSVFSCL